MTINKARKILSKLGEKLSDDELLKEIETASFIAELVIKEYKKQPRDNNVQLNKNA